MVATISREGVESFPIWGMPRPEKTMKIEKAAA
jgi:hypothetical protein